MVLSTCDVQSSPKKSRDRGRLHCSATSAMATGVWPDRPGSSEGLPSQNDCTMPWFAEPGAPGGTCHSRRPSGHTARCVVRRPSPSRTCALNGLRRPALTHFDHTTPTPATKDAPTGARVREASSSTAVPSAAASPSPSSPSPPAVATSHPSAEACGPLQIAQHGRFYVEVKLNSCRNCVENMSNVCCIDVEIMSSLCRGYVDFMSKLC